MNNTRKRKKKKEDLRSLHLRTKHWTETQITSSSTILLNEKEKYRQEETLQYEMVGSGQITKKP
jgi:hypothetical protein